MYQFQSSASEDPRWLHQHSGLRFALPGDGTDTRPWPHGQSQAPDLRTQAHPTFPSYGRSNATMQSAPATWSDVMQPGHPEGFLSSSADSCQSVSFQSCYQMFSPVQHRGFPVQSQHAFQWQSPSHPRPYTVSAPAHSTVHRQLSGHLFPSQGTNAQPISKCAY